MALHDQWPDNAATDWPNFSANEMACQCGCGMLPDPAFMVQLQQLRTAFGQSLKVSSGARCPDHNDRVSSTGRDGPHTTGFAADLSVSGEAARRLIGLASADDAFTGIGVKQHGDHGARFVHVDTIPGGGTQPRPWVWSYR